MRGATAAVAPVLAAAAAPGPTPPSPPSPAGLDAFIEGKLQSGKIPGLSIAVFKNDQILWDGQYGSCSKGGPAVGRQTVFEIASLSKTFVGVAAMVAYDMGLLTPDDDVNKFLPWTYTDPHFTSDNTTVHMLLTHTSGISDNHYDDLPGGQIYFQGDPAVSMAEFYEYMFTKSGKWYSAQSWASKHKPGAHFDYTNIGASFGGYIVELAAQKAGVAQTFDEFVRKYVLAPLGVTNAGYFVSDFGGEAKLKPPAGALPSKYNGKSYCFYSFPDYPDGAMKINALDYARVLGAVANGGVWQGTRLLNATTVTYMKKPAPAPCKPQPCGGDMTQSNAIFFYDDQDGDRVLGHDGGEMGIATDAFYNTKTGVGVVWLANGDSDSAFDAIERKLFSIFDKEGEHPASGRRLRRGRRRAAGGGRGAVTATAPLLAGCPCGLPC